MLKFSRYSYFISDVVKIKVSKHWEVTLATSTLNEFTLENVTAALSAIRRSLAKLECFHA